MLSDNDIEYLVRSYNTKKNWTNTTTRLDKLGNRIEFRMSLSEWLDLWLSSDAWRTRLAKRNGSTAVISRINDIGHYEIGNVFIQSSGKNVADAERDYSAPRARLILMNKARKGQTSFRKGHSLDDLYGRERSDSIKAKLSRTLTGMPKPTSTCPHCGKEGGRHLMQRWHFNNCPKLR